MSKHQRTIAVDFDGTLCEWAFPECGGPRTEVIAALRILREKGWHILIHTCRVNSHWEEPDRTEKVQAMLEWLLANDVPFDSVWGLRFGGLPVPDCPALGGRLAEIDQYWERGSVTGKPLADVYLDDRGIRCDGSIERGKLLEDMMDMKRI